MTDSVADLRSLVKQVRWLVVALILVVGARMAQEQFVSSGVEESVDTLNTSVVATKQTLEDAIAAGQQDQNPQLALAFQSIFLSTRQLCDLNPSPACAAVIAQIDALPPDQGGDP